MRGLPASGRAHLHEFAIYRFSMETYDLILVGLGAVGSAALCQSALRGARRFGDRFAFTRRTNWARVMARHGFPARPLARERNLSLWSCEPTCYGRLSRLLLGRSYWSRTAALSCSMPPTKPILRGKARAFYRQTVDCAKRFASRISSFTADEVRQRFPQFVLEEWWRGVYLEPGAGMLFPERCIAAQLSVAGQNRAKLRTDEIVTEIITIAPAPWCGRIVRNMALRA